MIRLLAWLAKTRAWKLVGVQERRRTPLPEPPAPRITIIVTAPAPPIDPHTATLRMRFATDAVPPGHDRPLAWHRYERIARAVRAEHGESST